MPPCSSGLPESQAAVYLVTPTAPRAVLGPGTDRPRAFAPDGRRSRANLSGARVPPWAVSGLCLPQPRAAGTRRGSLVPLPGLLSRPPAHPAQLSQRHRACRRGRHTPPRGARAPVPGRRPVLEPADRWVLAGPVTAPQPAAGALARPASDPAGWAPASGRRRAGPVRSAGRAGRPERRGPGSDWPVRLRRTDHRHGLAGEHEMVAWAG